MAGWRQTLYNKSPWFIKEWLVALEARRRHRYRRTGNYHALRQEYSFDHYRQMSLDEIRAYQLKKLQSIIRDANQNSPFYYGRLPDIQHLEDMQHLSILTKSDLRQHMPSLVRNGYPDQQLWSGQTSGSTGTPLKILIPRESTRTRFAILDNYYALFDCHYGERRVRMGGSKVKPADSTTPPFWIMNRPDNQLQLSPYHLTELSFPYYRDELNRFQPAYLHGYAHALYNMAQFYIQHGGRNYQPKALFLDSEGVPPHYKPIIEQGFGAPALENYGLGEVGLVAVEYPDRQIRFLDLSIWIEVVDADGHVLPDGESGRLIVTDLSQSNVPMIRYDTGDIGSIISDDADSEWSGTILKSIDGRSDDIIVTPKGRRVGRLSHVTKPGRGIVESQIAHVSPTEVVIRVVPDHDFDETSMVDVVHTAEVLLGTDMHVTWITVEEIPRTAQHKFKHVVREYLTDVTNDR